jgi:hypothetical protein
MATVLSITASVLTGDDLRRQHDGEEELLLTAGTVLTPTAWDYLREAGLRVVKTPTDSGTAPRTPAAGGTALPEAANGPSITAEASGEGTPSVPGAQIQEVQPAQMVCAGRCELPNESFGCKSEEFGSGFAGPGAASESAEAPAAELPVDEQELEALIQRITDLVMSELERG